MKYVSIWYDGNHNRDSEIDAPDLDTARDAAVKIAEEAGSSSSDVLVVFVSSPYIFQEDPEVWSTNVG